MQLFDEAHPVGQIVIRLSRRLRDVGSTIDGRISLGLSVIARARSSTTPIPELSRRYGRVDCNAVNAHSVYKRHGDGFMASITVRNLDNGLKRRLRIRAAEHGRSMEQEARDILKAALNEDAAPSTNLGTAIHRLFRPFGVENLEIPPREPMREPPQFD